MPLQVYLCPNHGEFEIFMQFKDEIKDEVSCPKTIEAVLSGYPRKIPICSKPSKHIIKPIACAIVEGGTGGGKDMHLVR